MVRFSPGLPTFFCSLMSVHMHSPHKSLPDMQPENMAFQSVACLQIPLTVPFTEQMFLTVALSNLYIFFIGQVFGVMSNN